MMIRFILGCWLATVLCGFASAADISVDFEGLLEPGNYENGAGLNPAGGFSLHGTTFNNFHDSSTNYWEGWAYSTMTDTTTPGWGNQYSAFPGSGADASAGYAIGFTQVFAFDYLKITLPDGYAAKSMMVTNTTLAALAILEGDDGAGFVKGPFTNDDNDYFLLEIFGLDESGAQIGQSIEFYLADFRSGANYVATEWETIDLTSLAGAKSLAFALSSTDNATFEGQSFMNTPAYFALDNLVLTPVPEPSALALMIGAVGVIFLILRRRRVAGIAG